MLGIKDRLCVTDSNGVHYCADPADTDGGAISVAPPPGASGAVIEPVIDAAALGDGSTGGADATPSDSAATDSGDATVSDGPTGSIDVTVNDVTTTDGGGSGSDATSADADGGTTTSDGGPESGDSGQIACAAIGTGAVGAPGCPCSDAGTLACSGNAQNVTLICSEGTWAQNQTCASGQLCDTAAGINQGTCQPIDPSCTGASPGANVCSNGTTVVKCGPDLVSDTPVTTCANEACVSGGCTGVCTPGAKKCSGNGVETCSPSGQWGSAVACPASAPSCENGACTYPPPSCQTGDGGVTSCGASNDSCCTSVEVDGGTYYRTYTNSGSGPTGEADPATVSGFRLDKYLVTVGRFRQFVAAWNAGWTPPAGSGKHTHLNGGLGLANVGASEDAGTVYEPGWLTLDTSGVDPTDANLVCDPAYATWTDTAGSQENLPITCVTWYEAYAFCIWDGGFLPSEAEWEYAAAGGSQQLEYPWGSIDPGSGNQYAIYACDYASDAGTCSSAPVGTATLGAGLWGQLDMAGEVWEWNLDSYAAYVSPCPDCADLSPSSSSSRVVRGGSCGDDDFISPTHLEASSRNDSSPSGRSDAVGFRCARTP